MNANLYAAGLLVLLGLFVAIAPWTIAPVCEQDGMYAKLANGKQLPMPCGWTARAEIGVGSLLVVAGALLSTGKTAEGRRMNGFFGLALGALVILFPAYITGMCALQDHPCNLLTRPVLLVAGVVTLIVAAWIVMANRKEA